MTNPHHAVKRTGFHTTRQLPLICLAAAALAGCANNPLLGFESGDTGVFFKRLSFGCVVGSARPTSLSGVSLNPDEVYTGESVAHLTSIERCTKEEGPLPEGAVKVTRQIVVGEAVVATSTEDVSARITKNGIWQVKSQINVGKNPPGKYQIRTTLEAEGRRQVRVNAFTLNK